MNVLTLTEIGPELGGFDWSVDGRPLGVWASRWTDEMLTPRRTGSRPT